MRAKHHLNNIQKNTTEQLKEITALVTTALQKHDETTKLKVDAIVQGSMGLLLHGVDYRLEDNPDDIDILISDFEEANKKMIRLGEKLKKKNSPYQINFTPKEQGSLLVKDYIFVDTTGKNPKLKVQLIIKDDFGLQYVTPLKIEGIPVLTPKEALKSLIFRIEKEGMRPKDRYAYFTLLQKYGKELINDPEYKNTAKAEIIKNYLALSEKKQEAQKHDPANIRGRAAKASRINMRSTVQKTPQSSTETKPKLEEVDNHVVTKVGMFKPGTQPAIAVENRPTIEKTVNT